jgi:hypothetical protein
MPGDAGRQVHRPDGFVRPSNLKLLLCSPAGIKGAVGVRPGQPRAIFRGDITLFKNDGPLISEPDAFDVKSSFIRLNRKGGCWDGRDFVRGEFAKGYDLGSGTPTGGKGLVREADEALQVVVEQAFPDERAGTAANFKETLGDEAAEDLVGGGPAGFVALGNLAFGEKLCAG